METDGLYGVDSLKLDDYASASPLGAAVRLHDDKGRLPAASAGTGPSLEVNSVLKNSPCCEHIAVQNAIDLKVHGLTAIGAECIHYSRRARGARYGAKESAVKRALQRNNSEKSSHDVECIHLRAGI